MEQVATNAVCSIFLVYTSLFFKKNRKFLFFKFFSESGVTFAIETCERWLHSLQVKIIFTHSFAQPLHCK